MAFPRRTRLDRSILKDVCEREPQSGRLSVCWLLGRFVLTEAFEPQRAARTTRRIASCETPESSATLRRDAFFSSTRCNTVGYSEAGLPSAGFFGLDLR